MLVCNFVSQQGKIRAEHELKKEYLRVLPVDA